MSSSPSDRLARAAAFILAVAPALIPACRFQADRRDLVTCQVTSDCLNGSLCLQGVCARPVDAGPDRPRDAATDALDEPEPDFPIPDMPPDAPPNIMVSAPTPGQLLPAGAFTFHAEVVTPGAGVLFAWKYMDGSCGAGVYCNKCPKLGVPKTGAMSYEVAKAVSGTTGELCASKALADWAHGDWLFVVQAGSDKAEVPFKVP